MSKPIFREYLGALEYFPDIVCCPEEELHFILGIGTEKYKDGKGTGDFNITWDAKIFSKERVLAIKKKYSNVKVILSFGGLGDQHPFNPCEKNLWINSAFDSIKAIIKNYYQIKDPAETKTIINTIDGIDINYEYITPDDRFVFTLCIGELITRLRGDPDLSLNIFSIAPSKLVQSQYESLYFNYSNAISWINYQFYLQPVSSVDEFVNLYIRLLNIYPQSKLLPGGTTDPKYAGNLDPNVFIEGIKAIKNDKPPLAGAFVWNAYYSSVSPHPFSLEKKIQQILCGGCVTA